MADTLNHVREFHKVYRRPILPSPKFPDQETIDFRIGLIDEEFTELKDAVEARDLVGVFDALLDLCYVIVGMGLEFGFSNIWRAGEIEVHRSNMSKLDDQGQPILREDGKVLKGPNYTPPDLKSIVESAVNDNG